MPDFEVISDFAATGDQPSAVDKLVQGVDSGETHQSLMGVTGSGKTFTMACVIEKVQRPTLVIAHNKTLAAQLATEFKEFFPKNAVEYFVSYYDYYQPEAYVPRSDLYIEKDADINEQLDKLRHAATRAILTRRDTLIVASVSCIFGLGSPEEYQGFVAHVRRGEIRSPSRLARQLIDMQYERNDFDLARGRFRIRGDTMEILPAYEDVGVRIEFWGDEVERIIQLDPLTGEMLAECEDIEIFPAKHFVTSEEKLQIALDRIEAEKVEQVAILNNQGKLLEAQRLESRTNYDMEMMRETGYCSGVENYSRHLSERSEGSAPYTLLDYFPEDYLLFIDESHMTLPQIRGMYFGDRSRKEVLVEYGFRLPSALDNRPLNFGEFEERVNQAVYVSATPGPYEYEHSQQMVEQVIRPTGLIDPIIEVKPTAGQIDDLLHQVRTRVERGERCLVTTLTKRMAEELADYLRETGTRTHYLHSEIDTLERSEILRDLRLGVYDVIVGINLLREGLDLPEVSLVAILDADKEGYLRSTTALVQTIGRASRHVSGSVIMYADRVTDSMKRAIDETERRRDIQVAYNREHGITPQSIQKTIHDINERVQAIAETRASYAVDQGDMPKDDVLRLVKDLESQMKSAARNLEFEKAALLRDQISDLRKVIVE
ncbi:MAG: excinuclease ABC subunit UvrB [SAR202 cluster bacterium]|nr:excinuclease ABC subunit UvrB [SAR202 cluster bacterium]MDP6799403.1 excinuclease ABC subunit UvrB [SAR202 cluster bacterium]MQG57935.1 excinuclease ABC subunit UvrB [SAR202 cluster bacterium]MQG69571.1 excinuclease ABC subunit UvrB [SAR202 cluster bacterium]HAL47345.1 excinuclease ABC subunit B [Dehalococcoidia bacterium]